MKISTKPYLQRKESTVGNHARIERERNRRYAQCSVLENEPFIVLVLLDLLPLHAIVHRRHQAPHERDHSDHSRSGDVREAEQVDAEEQVGDLIDPTQGDGDDVAVCQHEAVLRELRAHVQAERDDEDHVQRRESERELYPPPGR
jgi:hypothetical protein